MKSKLADAKKELVSQSKEKKKREAELIIANKELVFQNGEKGKLTTELIIANKELVFQNEEKEKRAAELVIANKELALQNGEKEKRAAELVIANKELVFQNGEKGKRAAELDIANKELIHQNEEKEKRAAELIVANKELAFQNGEKEKRAAELDIANKELIHQNEEKEKRATELIVANLELKKAEEKFMSSENQVRDFAVHLNHELENERTNLSREVHDVLGQQITALKMDMSWLKKKFEAKDTDVKERFQRMLSLTDEMVKSVRKISTQLRPGILDDLGLVPALEWQSAEFEKVSAIKCSFTASGSLPELPRPTATGIFRIYQETLTNVARHSGATKVETSVSHDAKNLQLTVTDNGKGLIPVEMNSKKTLGIIGMKERAAMINGTLALQSPKEGGTVVTLSVVLKQ